MLPPHGRLIGNPFGTEAEADRFLAYFASRARDGAAWIGGLNCYVEKPTIPGFEPSGLGARRGDFRLPQFRGRASRYAEMIHAAGAYATGQLTVQGGMPYSPSGVLANYADNSVPREMDVEEIEWLIAEYAFSAGEFKAAGLDGAELHANHEDLLQLFLSPATNRRTDRYGGDPERRMRLVSDVLHAIRDSVGAEFTIGVRLNMDEMFDGGYGLEDGIEIARRLEATGCVDYVSCVVGNNWGAPSYIQSHHYAKAQWAASAGQVRRALNIPVVYTGLIVDPSIAAAVIKGGQADVVGVARAMFADAEFVSKARAGRFTEIRPCIGTNDCIHRVTVEGLRFGCAVNPGTGREAEPPVEPAARVKDVLVAGGGPAGLELAALLAERGHRVSLWEKDDDVGGQLRIAGRARENAAFLDYIDFQVRRLEALGVAVHTSLAVTADRVRDAAPDVLAVATGSRPRRPEIPGVELPFVLEGRDVMAGRVEVGDRVVVIAMEDHMQPLTIAGFLTDLGKRVRILYPTPGIAPLVGKYSIGPALAKLSAAGAQVSVMERAVSIAEGRLATRNIYSGAPGEISGFDSVVLACGGVADSGLHAVLKGSVPETYVLGDAYVPRRLSFATRQAYALARTI